MNQLVSRTHLGKMNYGSSDTFSGVAVQPSAIIIPSIVNSPDMETTSLHPRLLDMASFPIQTFVGAGAIDVLNPDYGPATTPASTPSATQDSPTSEIDYSIIYTDVSTTISLLNDTTRAVPCPSRGCGKAFASLSHMHSHLRSHGAVREFICKQCPKSFARRHDLNRHVNSVHSVHQGIVKFVCTHCGKGHGRADSHHRHEQYCAKLTVRPEGVARHKMQERPARRDAKFGPAGSRFAFS
ncbi:hypothetical protein BC830DRAFT_1124132 [Chytriomyces sp. MP71]|nr:hypothetical protein BC830DRAFT_1124132 [Chytriomyces sp. MP71]